MASVNINFPGNLAQVDTAADLRAIPSYLVPSNTNLWAVLDLGRAYILDAGSLAVDDGLNVIKPDDRTPLQAGRWVYLLNGFAPGPPGPPGDLIADFTQVVLPLTAPTAAVAGPAGNLNGTYYYRVTFVTAAGETEPSQSTNPLVVTNGQVNLTNIPVSPNGTVTGRRIYRTRADAVDPVLVKLVTTINNNTATTFTDNIADGSLGADAPYFNTTGGEIKINGETVFSISTSSTSVGHRAGLKGYASTYFGLAAGEDVTNGFRLTGFGVEALQKVTTGYEMTAMGVHALGNTLTGRWNNAFGYAALQSLTTAESCNSFGHRALVSVTTGSRNDGFGSAAGILLATGTDNSLFGYEAGWALTTGVGNVVVGSGAGHALGAANFNMLLGHRAGELITGNANLAIGFYALGRMTTGGSNIAIGPNAGSWLTTENNRLFIDNQGRANLADAEALSLIVGEFSVNTALQWLRINGTLNVSQTIQIDGVQVVGPRGAAVTDAAGAAASTPTKAEFDALAATLNTALARLRAHGLISA